MISQPFTAAVVQAAPVYLDLERSVTKAIGLMEQARAAGARLVVFSELWLPGYPWWVWLGPPAWAAQRGWTAQYRQQAFSYDGPQAERLREAARRIGIVVVMGLAERDGNSLYIGQWLIDERGETLMRRRKLKPGAAERVVFGDGGADDLQVSQTSLGRIGALCCGEHRHPLFKYALHAQQEDVHVAAWPSFSVYQPFAPGLGSEVNGALSRVYAAEGGCYVLAPTALVTPGMVELLCDSPERRALLVAGGGHAQAWSPDGAALCEPLAPDQEGLLLVSIDPLAIESAKAAYDVMGHSARPELLALWRRTGAEPGECGVMPGATPVLAVALPGEATGGRQDVLS